jgi:hypothetical protein
LRVIGTHRAIDAILIETESPLVGQRYRRVRSVHQIGLCRSGSPPSPEPPLRFLLSRAASSGQEPLFEQATDLAYVEARRTQCRRSPTDQTSIGCLASEIRSIQPRIPRQRTLPVRRSTSSPASDPESPRTSRGDSQPPERLRHFRRQKSCGRSTQRPAGFHQTRRHTIPPCQRVLRELLLAISPVTFCSRAEDKA